MADNRFFPKPTSLSLGEVATLTGAALPPQADKARVFSGVAPLETAGKDDIGFLDNIKYLEAFAVSKAGACFVRPQYAERAPKAMVLLVTTEPYAAYAITAQRFYPESGKASISPQASVAKSAKIGKNVHIEPFAAIGENVEIGDGSRIGAGASISHAIIGKRAIIHPGARIGQDGFGFAATPKGLLKVPQLGRVLIGDDVEIGANSCIDRGAGPDTVIGDGCKIDNLVQIGHNVRLGKYVIITGQCGISGSTQIGDGAMLGAQSGFAGHLRIGKGAKLAARSGVMRDVPDGATYGGAPAMPIRDWHRQTATLTRVSKKKASAEE